MTTWQEIDKPRLLLFASIVVLSVAIAVALVMPL
jgi:hypothetical protein